MRLWRVVHGIEHGHHYGENGIEVQWLDSVASILAGLRTVMGQKEYIMSDDLGIRCNAWWARLDTGA
jgi:hypothetical protein